MGHNSSKTGQKGSLNKLAEVELRSGRVQAPDLRTFVDQEAFDASDQFFVVFALEHPAGGAL